MASSDQLAAGVELAIASTGDVFGWPLAAVLDVRQVALGEVSGGRQLGQRHAALLPQAPKRGPKGHRCLLPYPCFPTVAGDGEPLPNSPNRHKAGPGPKGP